MQKDVWDYISGYRLLAEAPGAGDVNIILFSFLFDFSISFTKDAVISRRGFVRRFRFQFSFFFFTPPYMYVSTYHVRKSCVIFYTRARAYLPPTPFRFIPWSR